MQCCTYLRLYWHLGCGQGHCFSSITVKTLTMVGGVLALCFCFFCLFLHTFYTVTLSVFLHPAPPPPPPFLPLSPPPLSPGFAGGVDDEGDEAGPDPRTAPIAGFPAAAILQSLVYGGQEGGEGEEEEGGEVAVVALQVGAGGRGRG